MNQLTCHNSSFSPIRPEPQMHHRRCHRRPPPRMVASTSFASSPLSPSRSRTTTGSLLPLSCSSCHASHQEGEGSGG
ncbi:hypothetical protein Hanom_Chr16g01452621 [Helianthus anomalus]